MEQKLPTGLREGEISGLIQDQEVEAAAQVDVAAQSIPDDLARPGIQNDSQIDEQVSMAR